ARKPTKLRNATISSTGNSAVSAFTTAEPMVNVADAASTHRIACRRAARRSEAGRTADVSMWRRVAWVGHGEEGSARGDWTGWRSIGLRSASLNANARQVA